MIYNYCPICGRGVPIGESLVAVKENPVCKVHCCPPKTLAAIDSAMKNESSPPVNKTFMERLADGFAMMADDEEQL